jgi:CelD/BcsL family acetyltransferase involved in cellulose biosynthesis
LPPVLETHGRIERIAGEWDELADRVNASPFARPGWFSAWHRAFGAGRLELLALRRDGRLVGLAPFERRAGRLASLTNWHTPSFAPLAEDAEALEALAEGAVAGARPWLSLAFLDDGAPSHEAFELAANRIRCRTRNYVLERSPYLPLDESWEDFEQRRLSAKRRSRLRGLERRLGDRGTVRVEVDDRSDNLDALLDDGFRVEASGWKGENGTAIASGAATRTFYRDIAHWAADRGWLRLAFLRLDERALAFDFSLEADGIHYLLKTGYDEQWRSMAPGLLLRRAMLRRAFEAGLASYDFLGAPAAWKDEWTDSVRDRIALEVFSPAVSGRAFWFAWAYARPAFKRLRSVLRR